MQDTWHYFITFICCVCNICVTWHSFFWLLLDKHRMKNVFLRAGKLHRNEDGMGRRKLKDNCSQHEGRYAHAHLSGARTQPPPPFNEILTFSWNCLWTGNKADISCHSKQKDKTEADKENWDDYIKNEQVSKENYSYCLVLHVISGRLLRLLRWTWDLLMHLH